MPASYPSFRPFARQRSFNNMPHSDVQTNISTGIDNTPSDLHAPPSSGLSDEMDCEPRDYHAPPRPGLPSMPHHEPVMDLDDTTPDARSDPLARSAEPSEAPADKLSVISPDARRDREGSVIYQRTIQGDIVTACNSAKCQHIAERLKTLSTENTQLREAMLKFDPDGFELNRKVNRQQRAQEEAREDVEGLVRRTQAILENLITLKAKVSPYTPARGAVH